MTFEELNLHENIMKAVRKKGFERPTAIQKRCIPEIRAGRDVVGQSLTGSGKTAAFGLPIIEKIQPGKGIQALILTPTRELANQVHETIGHFSSFTHVNVTSVYGGVSIGPQINALRRSDIVVATPGRMLDHIERNTINLKSVKFLVIDEADKMFEMGFIEDVEEIIRALPKERQTLLFSATIPSDVNHLIKRYLKNPIFIKEQLQVDSSLLKQVYYDVKQFEKFSLLVHLLKKKTPGLAIVFCGTRREVDFIAKNLRAQGIHVLPVHGGLSQNKRDNAVDSLKRENIQVLVATDVAARGLDISNISHIYNYDSPKTSTEYTHRIGRTARAGKSGEAVTILAERDHTNFRNVMSDRSLNIKREEVPQFERIQTIREEPRHGDRRPRKQFGNNNSYNSHGHSGGNFHKRRMYSLGGR
ncbi:MAG: DEAD/DEAH box helicase [Candidatus Nanoarchaeia archaeon]|nr:DEAD/DEAH box helicase [Candidatus Nanoarchaeia archaeon]MDD5588164.1 DEAD/DEAH box helicase [Candidatus Nanoarchaeia archaeon]